MTDWTDTSVKEKETTAKPKTQAKPAAATASDDTPSKGIVAGGQGVMQATELLNKGPLPGPQPQFTWSTDAEDVTITPVPNNPARAVVEVPVDEKATDIAVTVSATDPDGVTVTATKTVPILPREFSIDLQQVV